MTAMAQGKAAVGRPPKLFKCLTCGAVLGAAAVRIHKCQKKLQQGYK